MSGPPTYDHVSERLLNGITAVLYQVGAEADALLPTLPSLIGRALKGDLDAAGDASILFLAKARAGAMSPHDALPLADLLAKAANVRDTAEDNLRVAAVCGLLGFRELALGNQLLAEMHHGQALFMAERAALKGDLSVETVLTALAENISPGAVKYARKLGRRGKI